MDVLFCHCAFAGIIPEDRKREVLAGLGAAGISPVEVPDLCRLCAERAPLLEEMARKPGLRIVACHPRAVRWLFHRGGAPLTADGTAILNMRVESAGAILAALGAGAPAGRAAPAHAGPDRADCAKDCGKCAARAASGETDGGAWVPWFPVIDYNRCTNCGQCLEFCLFGVYEKDGEGRVAVAQPEACKTNCPACARICPRAAIIFPKVADEPINGAEITDENAVKANAMVNVEEYLGDNVYAALAMRRMKRRELLARKKRDGIVNLPL
jgi:NAD-dependent dihydropyrimidine dehydrogenase PreA subunit